VSCRYIAIAKTQYLGPAGHNPVTPNLDFYVIIDRAVRFSAAQAAGSLQFLPPAFCHAGQ
jgi:hypothetical protein